MKRDIHRLLDTHDGLALGQCVTSGEISSTALVEAVIERLERVDPSLNAVVDRFYDEVRAVSRRPVDENQPFAGVPTLIKDLFSPVVGALMTQGSRATGEVRADLDAETVARLRRAGCLLLGTSTSPEFGTSYTTESTRHGATRNPWDLARSAGGPAAVRRRWWRRVSYLSPTVTTAGVRCVSLPPAVAFSVSSRAAG